MAWSTTRSRLNRKYSHFPMRTSQSGGGGLQANRFFVELVNTLTQSSFAALPPPGARSCIDSTPASSTWADSNTRRVIPIPVAAGTWSSPTTRPTAVPIPTAASWLKEASSTLLSRSTGTLSPRLPLVRRPESRRYPGERRHAWCRWVPQACPCHRRATPRRISSDASDQLFLRLG